MYDSRANPPDPTALPLAPLTWRYDDELYDLGILLSQGATSALVFTQNPSNDGERPRRRDAARHGPAACCVC